MRVVKLIIVICVNFMILREPVDTYVAEYLILFVELNVKHLMAIYPNKRATKYINSQKRGSDGMTKHVRQNTEEK